MNSRINIGQYEFNHVKSVEIETSRKEMTQRAVVELPNIKGILSLEEAIKVGNRIVIRLGYDGQYHEEYRGYVTKINPGRPFRVECEDEMWKLKQSTVNIAWKSIKLSAVLEYLAPGSNINTQDITLTNFRLNRVSRAKAIQQIKDMYGLDAYFKNEQLYVGLAYNDGEDETIVYHFQRNIPLDADNLEYRSKDEVRVKLKAISFTPDNKKIEVVFPEDDLEDYEERTLHFYNKTEAELKAIAKERIKDFIYDGYRGSFTAFGIPRPRFGMIVDLRDERYPERQGRAFIDSVKTTYGSKGFRRKIELGRAA